MKKEKIILELLKSLNMGDSGYIYPTTNRIDYAIEQYNILVEKGIIKEEDTNDGEDT